MSGILANKLVWRVFTFVAITTVVWGALALLPAVGLIDDAAVAKWLSEKTPLQYLDESLRKWLIGKHWHILIAIAVAGFLSGLRAWMESSIVSRLAPPSFIRLVTDSNAEAFVQRRMPLAGREPEFKAMRAFVEADTTFSWMWLIGRGRQGKTRLAVETCIAVSSGVWSAVWRRAQAGLVRGDTSGKNLKDWRPRRPTLLIVDPVSGQEKQAESLVRALAAQAPDFPAPVRLLLVDEAVPNGLRRLAADASLSAYAARYGENALTLTDLDDASRKTFFGAVYAAAFGKARLAEGEKSHGFLLEFQHRHSGLSAVEVALPYLETRVRPGSDKVQLLLPEAVRARSIDERLKRFGALDLDPEALALCAAATIAGPLPWEEAQKLYPQANKLAKEVAAASGVPAGDAAPSFGEGEADQLVALCILADRPLPERHAIASLAWSLAPDRAAKFVGDCASVRYSDNRRLPSVAYGWMVHPPPAHALGSEDWLLLVYALFAYLLADKPDWPELGPTLISAVQKADEERLAQAASLALAAFLEACSDALSASQVRNILIAAARLCDRWPDNKTTAIAAADLAALAASKLSRDEGDLQERIASAAILEKATRFDYSKASQWLAQPLLEVRLRVLTALSAVPWPQDLAPLDEVRRSRQLFPGTRRILDAASAAVAAFGADNRVPAEALDGERRAIAEALATCDTVDENIGKLRALRWGFRDVTSPPSLLELSEMRRHGRSRALHEALAEVLQKEQPNWSEADLVAERKAVADALAIGDFAPPDSNITWRRFLHEHLLSHPVKR